MCWANQKNSTNYANCYLCCYRGHLTQHKSIFWSLLALGLYALRFFWFSHCSLKFYHKVIRKQRLILVKISRDGTAPLILNSASRRLLLSWIFVADHTYISCLKNLSKRKIDRGSQRQILRTSKRFFQWC